MKLDVMKPKIVDELFHNFQEFAEGLLERGLIIPLIISK